MAYDRENKIVYVDPSTDPDKGVEIADIQKVVPVTLKRTVNGVTERRSSADLGVLCSAQVGDSVPDNAGGAAWIVSSRIDVNPWAKYKPVPFDQLDTTKHPDRVEPWLNADKTWNSSAQWWRYRKAETNEEMEYRCGFRIPTAEVNNLGEIRNGIGTWTWYRPRGQQTINGVQVFEPFRKLDFNQYYHNAVCPYMIELPEEAHQPSFLDGKIGLRFPPVNALNLSLNDLFAQGDNPIYLGVAAIASNGEFRWRTQETDGKTFTFQGCDLATNYLSPNATRTLRLVAFACRKKQTEWTNLVETGKVISLEAPHLGFSVIGDCVIKPAGQISYAVTPVCYNGNGTKNIDDSNFLDVIRAVLSGELVTGRQHAYEQTSQNKLSQSYNLSSITVKVYEVNDGGGIIATVYQRDFAPSMLSATPTYLEPEAYARITFQTKEPIGTPVGEADRIPTPDATKHYLREYIFNYHA